MLAPGLHSEEAQRLEALCALRVLDTPPEARFDRLARLAAALFGTPTALVSLVDRDRQWFKARVGLDASETGRDISFCGHAILGSGPFLVPDATRDPRFQDNPLVLGAPHIRFYAGRPLAAPSGLPVGTLCVLGPEPMTPTPAQLRALDDLAALVERELALEELQTSLAPTLDLLRTEGLHRTLVESLDEGVVLQSPQGEILLATPRACAILGLSEAQLRGRTSLDPAWHCIHPDGTPWPGEDHPARRTLATGTPEQDVLMGVAKADGTLAWLRVNTLPVVGGPAHLHGGVVISFRDVTLERWREISLARKELRFHTLAAKAPVGILETDRDGHFTWVNAGWCDLAGLPMEAALGEGWLEAVHPEDRATVQAAWETGRTGELHLRYRFLRPDGTHRKVELRVSPLGEDLGAIGTVQDITDQEETLEALRDQEARYRLLVERTTDLIARHGPDGAFRFLTPSVRQVLGYAPEELLGQLPTAFALPEDIPILVAAHQAILRGEGVGTFRFRALHKDGGVVWLETEGNPVRNPATGQVVETVFTSRDISFRVAAEQDLQDTTTRHRAMMEAIPDELFRQTADGVYLDVHCSQQGLPYWPPESMIGRPMEAFLPPEVVHLRKAALRRALETGEPQVVEYQLAHEGRLRDFEARVVPAGPREAVTMVRDVTGRNLVDRMKSEFVSTVSHELRTPLTAIRGALGLLAGGAGGALSAAALELLDLGRKNTDRLIHLINDLLDLEKIQRGELAYHFQEVDLGELARQAHGQLLPMAEGAGVGFACDVPEGCWQARVDPDRLAQVLTNLLSNALKFSPPGTTITLRLREAGEDLRFEVEDAGPGVPEAFRERIFQRFTQADGGSTRQKGGTGLGLSIAKALVDRMEGTLDYHSAPGRTVFWVALPRSR